MKIAPWATDNHTSLADERLRAERINLLNELFAYGTHIVPAFLDANKGEPNEDLQMVPVLLLRRVLESTKAIQALVAAELPGAAQPHARLIFEAQLGLKHLYAEDTLERCKAYFVWYYKSRLAYLEHLDPGTNRGRNSKTALDNMA